MVAEYIETTFGGAESLIKDILLDFFRSAFDGSGADNFYDAGSCIDGRLTRQNISKFNFEVHLYCKGTIYTDFSEILPSAWNWCQQIANKRFYPVFKLCGFSSFDGEFSK